MNGVEVGQVWKRNPPYRERLRIDRVWQGFDHRDPDAWTFRAQPLHGGPVVIGAPEWLTDNFTREEATHE